MIHEQQCQISWESKEPFCRARILYMEDDIGLAFLLQRKLERVACIVETARDGQEGLKKFAQNAYDIVITDYNMPLVNGLEVLKELKDLIPVIILTGEGDEIIAVDAMKIGAADYVIKDVNGKYLEILASVIDRVLERQQLIKEKRQAQIELQASEARYRAIVEDQTEIICRCDPDGKLTFANEAFCRYFGIVNADVIYQNLAAMLSRKAYQHSKGILKKLTPPNPTAVNAHAIHMLNGKVHWIQWTNRAIFDDTGKLREYQLVGRDITEFKEVEKALRESEEKNNALLSAIPDPILRIDQYGTCIDVRSKEGQALKIPSHLIGKNVVEFFSPDVVDVMMAHINKVFLEGTNQVFYFSIKQEDSVTHQEARLVFAGGNEILVILRDITERNEMEQKLKQLCIRDSLTGLYNRTYFVQEMRRLEDCEYDPTGIVVCDVDGLKIINDNLGHAVGDELLKTASSLILQAFEGHDAIARIGGDEFAVLLPRATQEVVAEVCNRLRVAIAEYNKATSNLFISISVGSAMNNPEKPDLDEAFKQADEAMYTDKLSKRRFVRDAMVERLRLSSPALRKRK